MDLYIVTNGGIYNPFTSIGLINFHYTFQWSDFTTKENSSGDFLGPIFVFKTCLQRQKIPPNSLGKLRTPRVDGGFVFPSEDRRAQTLIVSQLVKGEIEKKSMVRMKGTTWNAFCVLCFVWQLETPRTSNKAALKNRAQTACQVHFFFQVGGFKYISCSPLFWGNDPIWRAYFSEGLKPLQIFVMDMCNINVGKKELMFVQ